MKVVEVSERKRAIHWLLVSFEKVKEQEEGKKKGEVAREKEMKTIVSGGNLGA